MIDENKFTEEFAAQFDETEPSLISLDTKFKILDEWSSLTALSIMAMVDEEYQVKLSPEDLKNCNTVGDILMLINRKV